MALEAVCKMLDWVKLGCVHCERPLELIEGRLTNPRLLSIEMHFNP